MKITLKPTFILAIGLVFTALTFESCKKYEEGPSLSFRSAKSRLVNVWLLEELKVDGSDATQGLQQTNYKMEFKKDDSFTIEQGGNVNEQGTWTFSSDKMQVITTNQAGVEREFDIMRLTNKEFWCNIQRGNQKFEYKFKRE